MLNHLRIKNVALITEAEIDFCEGLNILSGETGAGKSVILDSLNFVLGAKADKTMIRYGEQFCLVEASFSRISDDVRDILDEFDIEYSDDIIIKRKFDVNGNGYIRLNGESVTAGMLKKITSLLVDVHGQSDHFVLLSKTKQIECIDQGADVETYKNRLKEICAEIKSLDEKLELLGGDPDERARKIDIFDFQIKEIQSAELKDGEESDLLAVRERLQNAERISQGLSAVYDALSGESGATDAIIAAEQSLRPISGIDTLFEKLAERLDSVRDEVNDISDSAREYLDSLDTDADPDYIEQRIEVYRRLKRKYGQSLSEINAFCEKAAEERDALIDSDEEIKRIDAERKKLIDEYYGVCMDLSAKRKEYSADFAKRVKEKLAELGMPHAEFCIDYAELPEKEEISVFYPSGIDKAEFMFSANAGEPVKPLSKIISGGEMSRFMLALKTQSASACDTYVFDEIDAGISGHIASVVANNFARISLKKQIIAISHLPQISAMSDVSYLIEKVETDGKTYTTVNRLDDDKKVYEILRLVGGGTDDPVAIKHARNMIERATEYKETLKKQ